MIHWLKPEENEAVRSDPEAFIDSIQNPKTAEDFFALAVANEHAGRKNMSEPLVRRALQLNFCHLPSLYLLALKAFEKRREKDAKTLFRRVIRMDPQATTHALMFQKELKFALTNYEDAGRWGVWCLEELEAFQKASLSTKFQLGKTLFEQSRLKDAIPHLRSALQAKELATEATEYLSYIYEHIYRGSELIERILELAEEVSERSDLFFNLAMVCQHDQKRLDLAMHFFYLASREDPYDPGLRFSLEQAAVEFIAASNRRPSKADPLMVMMAHIYQGAMGVARKYAEELKHIEYPDSFQVMEPPSLWNRWLLKDEGALGRSLRAWFGPKAQGALGIPSLTNRLRQPDSL